MVLVGEDEQLRFDASHAGGVEGTHALGGVDAVILLAMYAEDGCVPLVNEAMRRVLVGLSGACRLVFVPVSIVVLPVGEPVLLSLGVHCLEVEGAVMRNEALEATFVMTCQIVNREAAKRGSDGTEAVFIDVRKVLRGIIYRGEVVLHALSGPVSADFLEPFLPEARHTATVRGNHDITLRSHYHKVPTVAPELTDGTLGAAFAEEERGIFLRSVKVRRQNHPGQHLLSVGCLHPTLFDGGLCQLVEDVLVHFGQLLYLCVGNRVARVNDIEVSGFRDAVTFRNKFLFIKHLHGTKVGPVVAELLDLALKVGLVEILCGVPNGYII